MTPSWLPKPWSQAIAHGGVFTDRDLAKAHVSAVRAWDKWRFTRNSKDRKLMEDDVGSYLDQAAKIKQNACEESPTVREYLDGLSAIAIIYWLLVFAYMVVAIAGVFTEDYPGGVTKPWQVWVFDSLVEQFHLCLLLVHACVPMYRHFFSASSGVFAIGATISKSYLVTETVVPYNPVRSARDRFNAIGPAVADVVKCVFGHMAQTRSEIPKPTPGEPFYPIANRGSGLSDKERRLLLSVVETSPLPIR